MAHGDMAVCEWRSLSAEKGQKIESVNIVMGVDDKGKECIDRSKLGLKIYRDAQELDLRCAEWLEDEPREKRVSVKLDPPIELEPVTLKWTYTWPGGFQELLQDGRGAGTFLIVERTDSLEVEFVSATQGIKKFDVIYHDSSRLRLLHEGDPERRGFEIQSPTRTQIVQFRVQV